MHFFRKAPIWLAAGPPWKAAISVMTMAWGPDAGNTFPIYAPASRPRLGTIGKNHIQSSLSFVSTALFCSSGYDTFLMNYTIF